jgi:phosphopantetheine--protein transferase-like protein
MFSIGCDMEDTERFVEKAGDAAFLDRVYTRAEQEYCLRKPRPELHLAARWCAKEAVVKALAGLGIGSVGYGKIEISNRADGSPAAAIDDPRCAGLELSVSLSHSAASAMAVAIISRK